MRVDPPSTIENTPPPAEPEPTPRGDRLAALGLAVSLAIGAGLLHGWDAGLTVFGLVLNLMTHGGEPPRTRA